MIRATNSRASLVEIRINFQINFHYENKLLGVIFFDIKLLLQPDVVFDSESNGRNLSCLAPTGGEKKRPSLLVTSFCKKMKIFFSRQQMALES